MTAEDRAIRAVLLYLRPETPWRWEHATHTHVYPGQRTVERVTVGYSIRQLARAFWFVGQVAPEARDVLEPLGDDVEQAVNRLAQIELVDVDGELVYLARAGERWLRAHTEVMA